MVITKLPNSERSYKGKVKTHNYINRQNQSTTGKLLTINLSFLPFYIFFLKCWHRLNEPILYDQLITILTV